MAITTLLNINLREILEGLEKKTGIKLPKTIIEASLTNNVLHIRFSHPTGTETDVEPLATNTPTYLFRDQTGKITALEILDIEKLTKELKNTGDNK